MNLNRRHNFLIALLGHLRWFLLSVLIPVWQAKFRYARVVRRLRGLSAGKKLKVLFVTGTPAKWKCQSLYDLMAKSDRFEPWICQTICDVNKAACSHAERVVHLEKCRAFYAAHQMNYVEAYSREEEEWTDLNDFRADIVFYNQTWDVATVQLPHHGAKTALTIQMPYFVANYGCLDMEIRTPFQRTLFRYCALNQAWMEIYEKAVSWPLFAGKILPVGHTALDPYYLNPGKFESKGYVIYAPHWSIDCPGNENAENYSTFLLTGRKILEFAQAHPEIEWVFRPHPTLKVVMKSSGIWKEDEIASYWDAWSKVGEISESGGYEKLFMESRAMITDCGSFLTEYACTGNPIIHLISLTAKLKPMKPSADLYSTYYQVRDLNELTETLEEVVVNHCDPKREERQRKVRESGLLGNYAAQNIMDEIEKVLGK